MTYFVIDIQQLITPLKNKIFQQNLVIASAIYSKLSVRNFIQIRLGLTFLLYNGYGLHFSGHSMSHNLAATARSLAATRAHSRAPAPRA